MVAKFAIGTLVRIRNDISQEEMCLPGHPHFTPEMRRFQGRTFRIERINSNGNFILEGSPYCWDILWLEKPCTCRLNRKGR